MKELPRYFFAPQFCKPSVFSLRLFFLLLLFSRSPSQEIYVHSFSLSGNHAISSEEIFNHLETKAGAIFSQAVLERDIAAILTMYGTIGYPFASVFTDSISIADSAGNLNLSLRISEGAKFFINEIKITGNTQTKAEVILREARFQQGDVFNQTKIEKFRKRLERLQLFSAVAEPQLYITSGVVSDSLLGGLLVEVKEGNSNQFDGVAGYVPKQTTGSSGGYFTGNIFIGMRNLFGTARKTIIRWQRETEKTQELELQYSEPWIFSIPLNAGLEFLQRKQDSTYIKTILQTKFDYAVTEEFNIGLGAAIETIIPSADLSRFTVFESETDFISGELFFDTRDNPLNPSSGVRYGTAFQQGTKTIKGPALYLSLAPERKFSVRRWNVDAEIFTPAFFRQVLAAGIHGRQISSSHLELSDLYQFGGTNSVRGYRENQFSASQLVWMNLEYRFLTGRASSFFGFFDAGYFVRPSDALLGITKQEQIIYGYGIGTNVESTLGILNISFALGRGDSFSQGKIHVGLINSF